MLNVPTRWIFSTTLAGGVIAAGTYACIKAIVALATGVTVNNWWSYVLAFIVGALLTLGVGIAGVLVAESRHYGRRHLR